MIFNKTSLIAGLVGAAFAVSSAAQAGGVPKKTAWTAYGTTSSGYAQAVAIGNMLKKHYGTNLRVIPGKNDISRMAPLRDKKAGYIVLAVLPLTLVKKVFLFLLIKTGALNQFAF